MSDMKTVTVDSVYNHTGNSGWTLSTEVNRSSKPDSNYTSYCLVIESNGGYGAMVSKQSYQIHNTKTIDAIIAVLEETKTQIENDENARGTCEGRGPNRKIHHEGDSPVFHTVNYDNIAYTFDEILKWFRTITPKGKWSLGDGFCNFECVEDCVLFKAKWS